MSFSVEKLHKTRREKCKDILSVLMVFKAIKYSVKFASCFYLFYMNIRKCRSTLLLSL